MVKSKKIELCFDIDGVICKTNALDYDNSKPIISNIKKINQLYQKGYIIKIFTARYMGRSKNKPHLAKQKGFKLTSKQLRSWKVKYHELIFGKPTYGMFIDDKNLFHKKNWNKYIDKAVKKLN